jgi:hypothetical protein
MRSRRLMERGGPLPLGSVLAQDVLSGDGRVALGKGSVLSEADVARLRTLPWSELHLIEIEPGDLHEDEAGRRLARAAAGEGVVVQPQAAGTWPLAAGHRGLFEMDPATLMRINEIEDLAVVTLPRHQVVLEGEVVGRVKIVPFVTREERVRRAEAVAGETGGLLRVRPFAATRVAVLVQESIDDANLSRFRSALEEKLAFFGSSLVSMVRVGADPAALDEALKAAARGAQLVAVAGSRVMDPLDPALVAVERAGARVEMQGVPLHPGTLMWLAYLDQVPVMGAPGCALFAKPTAFDLLLPRLLTGERLSRAQLVELGAGGLITGEMTFRYPPYRSTGTRGELG